MAPVLIPGSSEPFSIDTEADTSPDLDSDADGEHRHELSAVPEHPHSKSKTVSSSAPTQHRRQLSSVTHPTIPKHTQHASRGSDSAPDPHPKRKSIGSKLLSKIKPGSTDNKNDPCSATHSQITSGAHTPYLTHNGAESDTSLGADKLRHALAKEQQRRANTKQPVSSNGDTLRRRGIFRSRKSKQSHVDSDIDEDQGHRDSLETPYYESTHPADLERFRSDATRHVPGGLFDKEENVPPVHSKGPDRAATDGSSFLHGHGLRRTAARSHLDHDHAGPANHHYDDLHIDDEHDHHDYDTDDSDDTIAHLIREADGYDSIRYNPSGELPAGLDFDTLQAVREKERSLSENKDAQSGYSSYSGGAAKALIQPLLELEDIELETFLQNFARHTREVTVTRPAGAKKYRMPQWSDFRVSPEDGAADDPNKKRPSMLNRVDRGLHHLAETLPGTGKGKGTSTSPGQERSHGEMLSMTKSKSTGDDLLAESASEANELDTKAASPSKKKSKKTPKKQHSGGRKASNDNYGMDEDDWNLIVPSANDPDSYDALSQHDELRVNAEDEGVDGIAFCIAYILALVERIAPEEIDHHPDRGYREGLIRSHLERLYTIAPFWEQLGARIRRLYRWEDPKITAAAAMIYFVLWYTNMIPTAFILSIMFYIMRFKYFPPSESYLHDKVKQRMARGQAANTLSEKLRRRSRLDILNIYKRWIVTYGAPTQEAMGLIADFHEKVKNLILWRNPAASRRTLLLFGVLNLFVTFAPSQYVSKAIFFFLGITFFCLLPLQAYFPSHRKALSPLWWATFGAPTDAQFAVQLLRKRHLDIDRFAGQLTTAEDVRRAVRSHGNSKIKPRPDRREEGIAYDDLEDPTRASLDYVEMSNDATLKPRKLGSFFCQYKGLPGRLHVNTKYLYFTPLHSPSHKRGRTPVDSIESIVKTKSIRLMVWSSLGLKVVRNNGKAPLMLANVQNRDEAFNLILAVSTNAGAQATS